MSTGSNRATASTGQDPLQNGSAPGAALTVEAVLGVADASDLDRPRDLRELARASSPMTMISEFGDESAAAPIVPSWARGTVA